MENILTIHLAGNYTSFQNRELMFDISLLGFPAEDLSIHDFIQIQYPVLQMTQLNSIFTFYESFTSLYMERSLDPNEVLRTKDLEELYRQGIHFYIPLTNHYVDRDEYETAMPFLQMHPCKGNIVACYSDDLAYRTWQDCPHYQIMANVIKNFTREKEIHKALDLYDKVVLPASPNNDFKMLARIPEKDLLTLFANNNCRYTCSSPVCYRAISRAIRDVEDPYAPGGTTRLKTRYICNRESGKDERQMNLGYVVFDLKIYCDMGLWSFKLIPPQPI